MAFIDELIGQGGLPYGMEIETPKAHNEIDSIINSFESEQPKSPISNEDVMNIIMGTVGGGGVGKGIRQLILALKGKIKGGKMIPSQPIRKVIVGGPKSSDFTKEGMLSKDFLKKQYLDMVKTGEIDDILKSNEPQGFLQGLIDKVKKIF